MNLKKKNHVSRVEHKTTIKIAYRTVANPLAVELFIRVFSGRNGRVGGQLTRRLYRIDE